MAIARFLDLMCLALRASELWLLYAALQILQSGNTALQMCSISFVRVATVRAQCLDDTNGTIGKVEEKEKEEHNCVVAATRTNVVDPVAAAAAVNERTRSCCCDDEANWR